MEARRMGKSAMSNFDSDILIIELNNINYGDQELISNISHCEVIIGEDGMIKEQYLVLVGSMTSVYQSCGKAKDPERKPERNIGTRTPTTLLLPLLEPLSFLFIQHQNPSSRIFIIVASSPHLHFSISNPLEFLSFFLDS
jgi:hypothetical protein